MSHLLISAAHKSSGKTTVSIGVCAALRRRGLRVQPFKKGPDFIDPLWLGLAAGRDCHNLDYHVQSAAEIESVFGRAMQEVDFGLIEGNLALYDDSQDVLGAGSNAALARQLGAPVVLVLNAQGMGRSVVPLILGYREFEPRVDLAGIVLNNVAGRRHAGNLVRAIEHYVDIPLLGVIQRDSGLKIDERHLGLMPSNESRTAGRQVETLGRRIAEQLDLDRLLGLAGRARPPEPAPEIEPTNRVVTAPVRARIGYARDEAFGFYYPGDLQALRAAGAEMVPFDTLNDPGLPEIDGLFLGGGFPEMSMRRLEANRTMRSAVKDFVEQGGPTYAECGGLMYLCRSLEWRGERRSMVNLLPVDAVMHQRPQGRGYVRLRETSRHPWPKSADGSESIAAHEFHYSGIKGLGDGYGFAYEVERGHGIDGHHDGIVYKNLLANYSHMRDTGMNRWARRFVDFVVSRRSEWRR
jgi:cobyrinic acid a,c-diamide synthase